MSLTPEHIAEIRKSWVALSQDPDAMTELFYEQLFRIAPEVKPLFAGTDLPAQRKKLAAAIGLVVRHVEDLSPVVPGLQDLGRRHVAYGVRDAHYDAVGQALIHAIATRLGPKFTAATQDAWVAAYTAVATTMQAGAATALKKTA